MKKRNMSSVLVLLVFAVFMVSVMLVLLSGADTVRSLTQRDRSSFQYRTAVQYISTRIRQADAEGSVTADNSENLSVLVLTESIEGLPYQTRIYCCDGFLREMFCEAGADIAPEFGEEILPMEDFQIKLDGNALHISFSLPDGRDEELFFLLRSEGGVTQ